MASGKWSDLLFLLLHKKLFKMYFSRGREVSVGFCAMGREATNVESQGLITLKLTVVNEHGLTCVVPRLDRTCSSHTSGFKPYSSASCETISHSALSRQQKPFCGKTFAKGVNGLQINSMEYGVAAAKRAAPGKSAFAAAPCTVLGIKGTQRTSAWNHPCLLKVQPKYIKKTIKQTVSIQQQR